MSARKGIKRTELYCRKEEQDFYRYGTKRVKDTKFTIKDPTKLHSEIVNLFMDLYGNQIRGSMRYAQPKNISALIHELLYERYDPKRFQNKVRVSPVTNQLIKSTGIDAISLEDILISGINEQLQAS